MDRTHPTLKSIHSAHANPPRPAFDIGSGLFSHEGGDSSHALFAPLHYEPGYAYPLIVWLHGPGDDERQLLRIMSTVSMRNYVAVAPRGTVSVDESGGYAWRQSGRHIALAEQRIADSIDIARAKYNVAPRRIFLAGFDCGGTMAFRVGLTQPTQFAGVLSLCGRFPGGGHPFSQLEEARRMAFFLAVGRDSTAYPPEDVCQHLRLFHTAALSVTLRQYPCGQEISPQMLTDVDRWVIEQIAAPPASP
jgi:phospholipase/carboxylesterase